VGLDLGDAAGLAIFPALSATTKLQLVRSPCHPLHAAEYKERQQRGYFVEPASHAAGTSSTNLNVMGMRIRLKASFDISGYSAANQVILTAMKKYGMILADNGGNFFFQGVVDSRGR